jgi:sugar lactone lactonase YvrE
MNQARHLLSVNNVLGEGPQWNTEEQALYWVDIRGNALFRYFQQSQIVERFELGVSVSAFAFREAGGLLLATEAGFAFWDVRTQQIRIFANPLIDYPGARFNDGAVDAHGRFWVGTAKSQSTNVLFRLDPDQTIHKMDEGFLLSNGLGWSPDQRTMYFTDSPAQVIYAYDFDLGEGTIARRRVFAEIPGAQGVTPDGLCIDTQGNLWSACWGAWKVICFNPSGEIAEEVIVPVQYPSSCVFGGADLQTLYITSARTLLDELQFKAQPTAGDLFCFDSDMKGSPSNRFKG